MKRQLSIYMDEVELDALKRLAADDDRSLNLFVSRILRDHLRRSATTAERKTTDYDHPQQQQIQSGA